MPVASEVSCCHFQQFANRTHFLGPQEVTLQRASRQVQLPGEHVIAVPEMPIY
jgi:hypothetical protein